MTGRTLSHFEVLEKLGEGGMGVVYKARDTQLNRLVALKLLPPDKVADPERRRRFIQEARAASALNHPNIITIYEISQADAVDFIAMEFVAGRTLDQLIPRGGMKLADGLRIAVQIAEGLARAHAAGIIHRDLKPSNIIVADSDGQPIVKILDFGLAKLTETAPQGPDAATLVQPRIDEGTVLGTVAYMSPEQAEGKPVTACTDIFAFGAVLYEMLSGRRAFTGSSKPATLSAVMRDEPPPIPQIPNELEKLIARCLRKDSARRAQHMADVKLALQDLKEESESGKLAVEAPVRKKLTHGVLLAAIVAGLILLAAAVGIDLWVNRSARPAPVPILTRLTSDSGLTTDPALSPDGKLVAYASDRGAQGNLSLWLQQVGGGQAIRLTQSDADDHEPAFSPDGRIIAFRSERDGGAIYTISTLGGESRKIAPQGRRPQFSPDGNWIAYWTGPVSGTPGPLNNRVFIVASTGGPPKPIQPEFAAAYPTWSPDGKHLIFWGRSPDVKLSPNDRMDWWSATLDEGVPVKLGAFAAFRSANLLGSPVPDAWLPGGPSLLFSASLGDAINLWKVPISPKTWRVTGRAEQLTFGTTSEMAPSVTVGQQGALHVAFASLIENIDIWELPIDANRATVMGELRRLTDDAGSDSAPAISADGKKMVFISTRSRNRDIWVKDLGTGKETPVTITAANKTSPAISADGTWIAYGVREGQKTAIYGTSPAVEAHAGGFARLCADCGSHISWSSDGTKLLYTALGSGQPSSVHSLDASSGRSTLVVSHPQYDLFEPYFSPDDRWISFNAANVSRSQIHVVPYSEGRAVQESEWIAVTKGDPWDDNPRWSPDGNTLYFTSEADGFRCISAQYLDPTTKRPKGPPIVIYHSHNARRSLLNVGLGPLKISVARDKIVFNMSERIGNIWMANFEGLH